MPQAQPFDYDVFISYSHKDEGWVHKQLLPFLKSALVGQHPMRVCIDIDTECFRPGFPILDEMKRAVLTSAKTVIVLTRNYLKSGWTDFEYTLQRTLDIKERKHRVIPLLLKKCDLPPDIGMLVYIDFTNPAQQQQAFDKLLAALNATATAQPPQPTLPFNMAPPLLAYYVPRTDDLARLRERLRQGGSLALTAIHGMGGVGKSVLAAALARDEEAQQCFRDGVLWATLGPGVNEASAADAHLLAWGQMLGEDLRSFPTLEARSTVLRNLLANRHCLLVIDDVWPAGAAAAQALCGVRGADCCTLLTTRYQEVAGELDAASLPVDVLSVDEALALLQKRLGRDLQGDERVQAQELAQRVGYLPLALALAAAQVKMGRPWQALLATLRAQQPAADELDFEDRATRQTSLRLTFDTSYDYLQDGDKRRYRWLGAMAAQAPFREEDAAMLWDEPPAEAAKALQRLARHAVLEPLPDEAEPRYRQHLLLRDDARARMEKQEYSEAFGRHAAIYLSLAQAADKAKDYRPVDAARAQVMAALRRARRGYSGEPGPAVGEGDEARRMVSDWVFALTEYWLLRGLIGEWIAWGQEAVSCCRALGEKRDEGAHLGNLGNAYYSLGQVQAAIGYYEQALAIDREIGDRRGEGIDLNNLGEAYDKLGDTVRALQFFQQALAIARETGYRPGEANRLSNLSEAYEKLGDRAQAIACQREALVIFEELGSPRAEEARARLAALEGR